MTDHEFWERQEQVTRFAERAADERLRNLLAQFHTPSDVTVLDLGCAGGRNTVLLAQRNFDVYAVDKSQAMVAETRRRAAEIMGPPEAERRIRLGRMDDLTGFPASLFHLIVALGVYHQAESVTEWERALDETRRVLSPGGLLLTAIFDPSSEPEGRPLAKTNDGLFAGFSAGPLRLVTGEEFDAAMAARDLAPVVPSTQIHVKMDPGFRVTINGLYRLEQRIRPEDSGRH